MPTPTPISTNTFSTSHDAFVMQFVAAERAGSGLQSNPSLLGTLDRERQHGELKSRLCSLPTDARALFQGYTAPSNAAALRTFLADFKIHRPRVHAVDVHDLPAAYERLGVALPPVDFHVGNALDLSGLYADRSVDIIIQHFLMNCLPPLSWHCLAQETARLLTPNGIALITISELADPPATTPLTQSQFETLTGHTWLPDSSDLSAYDLAPDIHEKLLGRFIETKPKEALAYITRPQGRFEFFVDCQHAEDHLKSVGLDICSDQSWVGRDSEGLRCRRHQLLVIHRSALNG